MAREPKDVAVSYCHHSRLLKDHNFIGTISEFVDHFVNDTSKYSKTHTRTSNIPVFISGLFVTQGLWFFFRENHDEIQYKISLNAKINKYSVINMKKRNKLINNLYFRSYVQPLLETR